LSARQDSSAIDGYSPDTSQDLKAPLVANRDRQHDYIRLQSKEQAHRFLTICRFGNYFDPTCFVDFFSKPLPSRWRFIRYQHSNLVVFAQAFRGAAFS
jgi:hypothetical protein